MANPRETGRTKVWMRSGETWLYTPDTNCPADKLPDITAGTDRLEEVEIDPRSSSDC